MFGYCDIGSPRRANPPPRRMTNESTDAKMGRSMKK
jgi:hypothetical protein